MSTYIFRIIGSKVSVSMTAPPPKPIRTPRSKFVQTLLSSCFARPSSKSLLDHTASAPQSQLELSSAKTSSHNETSNKPFHFFDLPPELRNMVYYYSLPQDVLICGHEKPLHRLWRRDLGLLSVSRRVREESRRILYIDTTIHISLEDFSSYRAFLAWINMVEQEDVRRIKELKIYAWMELNRNRDYVTSRNSCYHIRLKDGLQLADEASAKILSSAVIPRVKHCWVSPKSHICSRPDGEVCSLDMFQTLLDELDWDYSHFRITDIKAMVNGLFQYSSLHNAAQPVGDNDLWRLLDSPAGVSLIDSFAYPKGRIWEHSIANSTRKLK